MEITLCGKDAETYTTHDGEAQGSLRTHENAPLKPFVINGRGYSVIVE